VISTDVATSDRFSGTQPPVPSGEPVACLSSAAASQSESSLKLRLSLSEQPAVHTEPVTSPALPSTSAGTPVVHTPVCTTPPVTFFACSG
jgi:hypothetical protein